MHTFKEYMQTKFVTIPMDGDSLRGLMGSVIKKLPQDAANALDTPITLDELRCAVRKGKFNKVPSADGIIHDLFKTMWETIKDDLLEIINHMYIDGKISDNQKHGMIICVPKKPRPTRPEDFRHLTLLNADLKLMSRILANRISPWLISILHPSQHCGIYGHSIFEAIATVREAIAYTEYTKTSMCVLSIDFKDAFDNISHDYLFQLLEIYGFSKQTQTRISQMYKDATSSVYINGHRMGKFPINCSVRKGCPLSMQLFAICMDPLFYTLKSTLMEIRIGKNGHKSAVIAYADDVTLLLTSPSEIPKLQAILDQYGKASGAKINIQNSKAMAVGMWDTTVNIMGIPYHENVKILGVHFTNTTSLSAVNSWSVVTDGLRAQAREAYYRELSLNKRIQFVHTYMLARV